MKYTLIYTLILLLLCGCASQPLSNFYKVDDHLYRGAQPTQTGFDILASTGINIRTVVCLRNDWNDNVDTARFNYVSIPLNTWKVGYGDILTFLKVAKETNNWPIFVHCKHGSDRTGTMVASYRIMFCGWTKEQALDEMKNGPYGFHWIWLNLPKLIDNMDIEEMRRKLNE